MSLRKLTGTRSGQGVIIVVLALLTCLLLLLTVLNASAPEIDLQFGETTINISADRAWTLYPGDCVNLSWELEGIKSLYIEREGKMGWGEMVYCPSVNSTSPRVEVTAQNGIYRRLDLEIHHLPDLIFYLVGFIGLVGTIPLAAYYLWAYRPDRPTPVYWLIIGAILLSTVGAWVRLIPTVTPIVDEDNGDVAVRMWAEKDRIVFPYECANVWWSVVGAQSLTVNGDRYNHSKGLGTLAHCEFNGEFATLTATSQEGDQYTYELPLPSLVSYSEDRPLIFYWSLLGLVLGALVFVSLTVQTIHMKWRRNSSTDFLAVVGCFLFVIILFLPFGFNSAGHYEEWAINAHLEGKFVTHFGTEFISRFWSTVPHTLVYLVSSESFVGYHLVHLMLHTGKMVLLYSILRKLKVEPFYAFLSAILLFVYPVNSASMSLRSFPLNGSMLWLLYAVYLALAYSVNPRRLALLGLWMALMFNVFSNESAFAIIFVVPLLWWLRSRRLSWRNINLTIMWYLIPMFKAAYLFLLIVSNEHFYGSEQIVDRLEASGAGSNIFGILIDVMKTVYRHTFVESWQEAFAALGHNMWWPFTLIAVAGVGGILWYVARISRVPEPDFRRGIVLLLSGMLFIIPAVGVLMWIPIYRYDPWRMYFFVPIGAAIALLSIVVLLTMPIRHRQHRRFAVIGLCLLIMIPALSRLFVQHDKFVNSANSKARIYYAVLELAPRVEPDTQLMILSDMDVETLMELDILELVGQDVVNSAFFVLYGRERPESAYFCLLESVCGIARGQPTIFTRGKTEELLQRTLVFRLNDDLSVDLIEDPAAFLGLDIDIPYDASQLYDADAPLPPRATTMLGAALRE